MINRTAVAILTFGVSIACIFWADSLAVQDAKKRIISSPPLGLTQSSFMGI